MAQNIVFFNKFAIKKENTLHLFYLNHYTTNQNLFYEMKHYFTTLFVVLMAINTPATIQAQVPAAPTRVTTFGKRPSSAYSRQAPPQRPPLPPISPSLLMMSKTTMSPEP